MGKVIAAYGGGFKPPQKGHFQVVEEALDRFPEIDEFIIYIGAKERDGISQAESVLIWEIYQNYLPMKVKIEPVKAPIGDIIRLSKKYPQDTIYFIIGAREGNEEDQKDIASRTKGLEEKKPNIKVKTITTKDGNVSGTKARQAAKVSPEELFKYIPEKISDEDKQKVYDIVGPVIKETLNEGRYDKISNQISSDIFKYWKEKINQGLAVFEGNYEHEGEDIEVEASLELSTDIDELKVDGGADDEEDFIAVNFKVNPNNLPGDWKKISFSLKDVIRHEIEHLTHGEGFMLKPGKSMENDQILRQMIDSELLPRADYFKLEKEIDANLQGMYFRAKKERRPFKDVVNVYLDTQELTPEEKAEIMNLWNKRTKALGLPSIQENLNEEVGDKILYAFDLDDTLITSQSDIIITNPEKGTFKLTPAEYAVYEPHPEDEVDFAEFDYLKDPKIIKNNFKKFSMILKRSSQLPNAQTIILTARKFEVAKDLEEFLSKFDLPEVKLHAVGSSDPNDKVKVVQDYIDQGYNKIRFWDDSPKNIKQMKVLNSPEVDVRATLIKHGPLGEILLKEVIKESYQFKPTSTDYDEIDNSLLAVEYKFTTPSNTYRVEFYSGEYNPEDMIFDLSFGVDSGELNKLDTFQHTGEGNAREIIKTLSNIIEDFFTKHPDVKKVVISGTDDKRKRVYKYLLPKHLSPNTLNKVSINENATYSTHIDYKKQIQDLTQHMLDKGMNIEPLPQVEFVDGDSENAENFFGRTAYYDPNTQTIVLYTEGRHPKDIVRSFSHEMIHHIQNLEDRLEGIGTTNTTEDDNLNKIEQEAYLNGNITFRNWTDSLQENISKDPNLIYHWTSYLSCRKIIESDKLRSNESSQFFEYDESRDLPDYKNVVFFTIEGERFADEETSNQCVLVVDKSKLSKDYKVISYGDPYEETIVYTNDPSIPILPYLKGVLLMNTLQKSALKKTVAFLESKNIPYEINYNLENKTKEKKAKLPSLKKELINKLKSKYPNGFVGYLERPLLPYQTIEYFKDNPTYRFPKITINKPGKHGEENEFKVKFDIKPQNLEKYINWFMYSPDSIEDLINMGNYEGEELNLKGEIPIDINNLQEKKDKDYFGLNQFARELAQGLEEETENIGLPEEEVVSSQDMDYVIYSDMDGVIVDFEERFKQFSDGVLPSEFQRAHGRDKFWDLIDNQIGVKFWVGAPWMPDGKQYWDYIEKYNPILLSSPSRQNESRLGKRLWVKKHIPGTPLKLAYSANKKNYARENAILIDDRKPNIDQWIEAGGIGILHINAKDTIAELKKLGL